MEKDSVIVVYIPSEGHFAAKSYLEQFYALYYSVVHKSDLYKKFDFLVTGNEIIKYKIPEEHCRFVEIDDLSKTKDFCYVYSGQPYRYVNSWAPFIDDNCVEIIKEYDYCLRLDVDTFLCPPIADLRINEDEIYTGNGGYSSETARRRLPEILTKFDLAHRDVHDIGSTWFSTADNMIKQGARVPEFVKYLIHNHFTEHEGSWPQWYAGVATMYGGDLALNSSGLKIIKTDKLDYYSSSDNNINDYYSIHAWHCDDFYSKHWFMSGKYKDRKPKADSLQCNEYAFDCVVKGVETLEAMKRRSVTSLSYD